MNRAEEARFAGFAYVLTIAAGLFAEVWARGLSRLGAASAPHGFGAYEGWHRVGIFADLVMIAAYLVVTVLLYRLLRPASSLGSGMAAVMSGAGLAMLAAGTIILLYPLQEPAFTLQSLRLHGSLYNMSGFFFGLYCITIGWLLMRSRLVPRWVAGLMALAGIAFLADSVLTLVAPAIAQEVPDMVMLLSLLGEGALALWLAIFADRELRQSRTLQPGEL